MKREPGFYWVEERGKLSEPLVAEWRLAIGDQTRGHWHICGYEDGLLDGECHVLSERLVPPGESCAELGCSSSFHKAYCPKFKQQSAATTDPRHPRTAR